MRLQLQQEENRSPTRIMTNWNNDEDSHRRDDYRRLNYSNEANSDLLKDMRREMDELRNAMREKTDWNLDGMVRRTNSPFTTKVLECPIPPKFRLPQLESFDSLKDPLDHITTFKMTLKGATRVWFSKLAMSSIDNFEKLGNSFVCHFVDG